MKKKNKNENGVSLSFEKSIIILSCFYALFIFLIYYFALPFLNFNSVGFYFFITLILGYIGTVILMFNSDKLIKKNEGKVYTKIIGFESVNGKPIRRKVGSNEKFSKGMLCLRGIVYSICICLGFLAIMGTVGSKLFMSKSYYKQLTITEGTEEELLDIFNYDDGEVLLPIIDKDLAFKLAQASLGDYGAQYSIDYDNFTLQSVTRNGVDKLVRIAPLEYSTVFVSLARMNKGTIGYIEVNVVTKETKLVIVDGGLKYMPTSVFGKDLSRHVRFQYPTRMYQEFNFEIDDEGNPFWIIPTYKKEIFLLSGTTPNGVIVVNPVNGESEFYELGKEPKWIDRTVDERIVEKQSTNALKYKHGFFNVYLGEKKEVFQLSDGYNYFIKDGNTYLVSSITSPNENDQTSIGFVAVNLKTKQATKYFFEGITEMRAREIAMNDARVKAQALDSTWPILISYDGVETYFLVLKNAVKSQKIVYIDVKTGELVAIGDSIEEAKAEYDKLLTNSGNSVQKEIEFNGIVTEVRDLNDFIEFMIDSVNDKYFVISPTLNLKARFIEKGDNCKIICYDYDTYYYVVDIS